MQRSIRRLTPETASRIAAGEVIERPLSALKEILENALDAGARMIETRVEGTLDRSFQIADDGVGIPADDMELALERHATSKIASLDDLDALASLGFRGEALPSIAAVSRLRITSRVRGADAASLLVVEGGRVVERGHAARATGTTVEVADLFFNTPARRKFMHSGAGELRSAIRLIECYALAFPEVSFRLLVDGRERFHWPAAAGVAASARESDATSPMVRTATAELDAIPEAAARRERAAAMRGARHAEQLVEAAGERGGIRIAALLGLPEHARATREGQVFLVNRRWVQSPMIGHALRQAYGNLLPHGRFPAGTLWLSVPPALLDVNVHPTKREVRFANDQAVFSLIAAACSKALAHLHPPFTVVPGGARSEPSWAERVREKPGHMMLPLDLAPRRSTAPSGEGGEQEATAASESEPSAETGEPAGSRAAEAATEPELWQLHNTYILAPVRDGLVIIDQHAAHERILYEEARRRLEGARSTSQQLLFPALVDLSRSQYELLLEIGPWLKQLGWDITPLGPPSIVIQGVPSDLKSEQPGQILQDVLDGVSDGSGRQPSEDIAEHLARSYACHAATRAGDSLTRSEMKALVDRLFATSKPHGDPHGRVTFVRLDMNDLHRRFGRT